LVDGTVALGGRGDINSLTYLPCSVTRQDRLGWLKIACRLRTLALAIAGQVFMNRHGKWVCLVHEVCLHVLKVLNVSTQTLAHFCKLVLAFLHLTISRMS
jgi:hypothetical protein